MTNATLTRFLFTLPGTPVGPESPYPLLCEPMAEEKESCLAEDEGLYVNYGRVCHMLPFSEQTDFARARAGETVTFDAYRLENDRLRAVFLPALGGRLWSLYDKQEKRDLVVENTVFQPCNFAVRGAWVSGGIEWNCGVRGHSALTCDRIFAAPYVMHDGEPALRLYAFERTRAVTYQMDFFLRSDLPFLFARMRIVNASHSVTPIYWWSTTAVRQEAGARVLVPADAAYVNQGGRAMYPVDLPTINGRDLTYPTNHTESVDHFYKIPAAQRKFEGYVFADGKGLMQASTRRLTGRKLFVWGVSRGGDNWQRFLTDEAGYAQPYVEIQAGLAATQNESLPMPPDAAWEWLEAYGPLSLDPAATHGAWPAAKQAAADWLEAHLPEATLDALLHDTQQDALLPAKADFSGHGWGALDNCLRAAEGRRLASPHLDFGEPGPLQAPWLRFLRTGKLDEPAPDSTELSFLVQEAWFRRIRTAARGGDAGNWYALYQLGLGYFAREFYEEAVDAFTQSLRCRESSYAYHGRANALRVLGHADGAAADMLRALALDPACIPLAKEALRFQLDAHAYGAALAACDLLPENVRAVPIIQALTAACLAAQGGSERARALLTANGGLQPPDLREGDNLLPTAYIQNEVALAAKRGERLDPADVAVPAAIDFRMFAD